MRRVSTLFLVCVFGCGGTGAARPEPVTVTALPDRAAAEPAPAPAPVAEEVPKEAPAETSREGLFGPVMGGTRDIRFRVVVRKAGSAPREWDLDRDPFRLSVVGWQCLVGRVSVSKKMSIANGQLSSVTSESRELVCKKGAATRRGGVGCGYAEGQVAAGSVPPPVGQAVVAIDAYRLTLSCRTELTAP